MKQNNLGNYDTIYDVWSAYPEGGKEGDYLFIDGVKCVWDKYDNKWVPEVSDEDKTLESFYGEVDIHKGLHVGEDVTVNGNLITKGAIISKKVSQPSCGLFSSVEALQKAYPKPYVGMWAAVGDAVPAPIYRCETIGVWTPTGDIGYADGPQGEKGDTGERGPQGPQGNSGYTGAADELEVVNDLQQGGATAALSAEMGKELTRYANYGRLVCKGTTVVASRLYAVVKGHRYRLNVKTPDWDVSSFGESYASYTKFGIYKVFEDGSSETINAVTIADQPMNVSVVEPAYIFKAGDYPYIAINARGVEGQVVEYALEDITAANTYGYFLEGSSNIFVSKDVYLRANRRYRVTLPVTDWAFNNRKGAGGIIWQISYEVDGVAKYVTSVSDFAKIKPEYFIEPSQDGLYNFGGRADSGVHIFFNIDDITEDWTTIPIVGQGEYFIQTRLRNIIAGRNYRLTILSDEWPVGEMETTQAGKYQLELFYAGSDGSTVKAVTRAFGSTSTIEKFYDFAISEGSDPNRVYLGIRATSGAVINFRLELMPDTADNPDKSSVVLVGKDNTGVVSKIRLIKDVTYRCYLPDEKWDTSNITITYEYYYFEIYYFDENNKSKVVKGFTSNTTRNPYESSFEFTAPVTAEYRIYIRANQGVEVPVTILPSSGRDELSPFEEQMYKACNLGFKRLPSTATEGYVPTLSFLHISDTHCTPDAYLAPFERTVKIFNKLAVNDVNKGKNVKFLLHTGDVRNHAYTSGYDFFYKVTADLKRNIYVTAGNHDVGHKLDATIAGTDAQIYEQMIAPMLEKWALKSDGGGTPHPDGKNYYFSDFTDEKVRMIFLYEWETDFELNPSDASLLLYDRSSRAFRQEQIDWFINSLLTTPAGYGVIVVKHQPESVKGEWNNPFFSNVARIDKTEMSTYCGTELIAQIVQGFIDRTTINITVEQTGGVVTTLFAYADFSAVAEGAEFICYCSGHTHQDIVNFLRDYPKQLELNIGCNNVHYTEGSDMLQEEGGKSEVLMNVYNIDRNRGYVYIVRIGADFSNTAQDRSFTAIKYR